MLRIGIGVRCTCGITISSGDIIHANSEGVIRIPDGAVPALLDQAPLYRAFEHEVHQLLRRSDIKAAKKREMLDDILNKYDFKDCTTAMDLAKDPERKGSLARSTT
jgi:regulator of RNase E activity RraA